MVGEIEERSVRFSVSSGSFPLSEYPEAPAGEPHPGTHYQMVFALAHTYRSPFPGIRRIHFHAHYKGGNQEHRRQEQGPLYCLSAVIRL